MRRFGSIGSALLLASGLAASPGAQSRVSSPPVAFEGARLIIGDGSAPIESGTFVVQDGRITAVGPRGR